MHNIYVIGKYRDICSGHGMRDSYFQIDYNCGYFDSMSDAKAFVDKAKRNEPRFESTSIVEIIHSRYQYVINPQISISVS